MPVEIRKLSYQIDLTDVVKSNNPNEYIVSIPIEALNNVPNTTAQSRANKFLKWSTNGSAIEFVTGSGGGSGLNSGSAFPSSPSNNDLFVLTTDITNFDKGLYQYQTNAWVAIATDLTKASFYLKGKEVLQEGTGISLENSDTDSETTISVSNIVMKFRGLYSSSATYIINDVVIQEDKAYVCNTAITTPETFTEAKWTLLAGATGGSGGGETAGTIKQKLETLTGTDRLSASAIQGLPSIPNSRIVYRGAYSNSATYDLYDLVIQAGVAYICTTAILIAEEFKASKWQALGGSGGGGAITQRSVFDQTKEILQASTGVTITQDDADAELILSSNPTQQQVYTRNKNAIVAGEDIQITNDDSNNTQTIKSNVFVSSEIDGSANAEDIDLPIKEKVLGGIGASTPAYTYSNNFEGIAHALYDPDAPGFRGFLTFSNSTNFQVFFASDQTIDEIRIADPNSTSNPVRTYTSLTKFSDSSPVSTQDPFGSTHTGFTFSDSNVFDNYTEDQLRKLRFRFFNSGTELTSTNVTGYKTEVTATKKITVEDLEREIDKIRIKEEDKTVDFLNKFIQLYNPVTKQSEFITQDTFEKAISPFHVKRDQQVNDYEYKTATNQFVSGGALVPGLVSVQGNTFWITAKANENEEEFVKAILDQDFRIEVIKDASNFIEFRVLSTSVINLSGNNLIFGNIKRLNEMGTLALDDEVDVISHGSVVHNNTLYPTNLADGAVLYFDGEWKALPKGTDGQILTLNSGLPAWQVVGGGAFLSYRGGYNTANTYAVNDVVIQNSTGYVCNTAITTPETFNAGKWTALGASSSGGSETGATIKSKLESLAGSARLNATAIQGLPTIPASRVVYRGAYSSSSTYALYDLVIQNNIAYICTTAITTAEAFTASKWQALSGSIPTLASGLMNFRGAYSSSNTYALNDVVIESNVAYVCTTAITTGETFTASKWQALGSSGGGGGGGVPGASNFVFQKVSTILGSVALTSSYSTVLTSPVINLPSGSVAVIQAVLRVLNSNTNDSLSINSKLQVRSASTETGVSSATWSDVSGTVGVFATSRQDDTDDEHAEENVVGREIFTASSSTNVYYQFRVQSQEVDSSSVSIQNGSDITVERKT